MGQGLNTKLIQVLMTFAQNIWFIVFLMTVIQIASRVLKIPHENISIIETGTDKVPNAMPTGGSIGTDIYGPALNVQYDYRVLFVTVANSNILGSMRNFVTQTGTLHVQKPKGKFI